MRETLQRIFSEHFARKAQAPTLHLRELQAASAIISWVMSDVGRVDLLIPRRGTARRLHPVTTNNLNVKHVVG